MVSRMETILLPAESNFFYLSYSLQMASLFFLSNYWVDNRAHFICVEMWAGNRKPSFGLGLLDFFSCWVLSETDSFSYFWLLMYISGCYIYSWKAISLRNVTSNCDSIFFSFLCMCSGGALELNPGVATSHALQTIFRVLFLVGHMPS
jgi:hypothetical protein